MSCPTGECGARRHDIFSESVGDGEADVDYPAFVDAEGRCPREDVGAGVHSTGIEAQRRQIPPDSVGTAVTPCPGVACGSQRDAR